MKRIALTVAIMFGVAWAVRLAGLLLAQVSLKTLDDIALYLILGVMISYVVGVVGYACWLIAGALLND